MPMHMSTHMATHMATHIHNSVHMSMHMSIHIFVHMSCAGTRHVCKPNGMPGMVCEAQERPKHASSMLS